MQKKVSVCGCDHEPEVGCFCFVPAVQLCPYTAALYYKDFKKMASSYLKKTFRMAWSEYTGQALYIVQTSHNPYMQNWDLAGY